MIQLRFIAFAASLVTITFLAISPSSALAGDTFTRRAPKLLPFRQGRSVSNLPFLKSFAALHAMYLGKHRPIHRTPGGGPETIDDLIATANGGDLPYTHTYGSDTSASVLDQGTFPTLSAFNFNSANLLPGLIVQGRNENIQAGQLVFDPLPRAGGTMELDTATLIRGAPTSIHLNSADKPALDAAKNSLINSSFDPDQSGSFSCTYVSVKSSADASYAASLSFGYSSMVNISNTFKSADSSKKSHLLIDCQDVFYTLSFIPDSTPSAVGNSAFFSPTLSSDVAKTYIAPNNPPLLVASVNYGAELFLIANSDQSSSDMEDALNAAFSYASAHATASFSDLQKSTLDSMEVNLVAIGGRASAQTGVYQAFNGASIGSGLIQYLENTVDFAAGNGKTQETALPLNYQLTYLDFTPVAETATIYGNPNVGSDAPLTAARVHFHQDGDGKDWDTEVDLAIKDQSGRQVAYYHIGKGTKFVNNGDSDTFSLPVTDKTTTAGTLDQGKFDLIIHPVGDDTWKFTAYLTLTFADGTSKSGQYSDRVSNHRTTKSADPATPNATHTNESLMSLSSILH